MEPRFFSQTASRWASVAGIQSSRISVSSSLSSGKRSKTPPNIICHMGWRESRFLLRKLWKNSSDSSAMTSACWSITSSSLLPAAATTSSYIFSSCGKAVPSMVP